jgi:hypothetical protein
VRVAARDFIVQFRSSRIHANDRRKARLGTLLELVVRYRNGLAQLPCGRIYYCPDDRKWSEAIAVRTFMDDIEEFSRWVDLHRIALGALMVWIGWPFGTPELLVL